MQSISSILKQIEAASCSVLSEDNLQKIKSELHSIIKSIGNCETFESAEPLLKQLGDVQFILAKLSFKHRIELPDSLRQVVRDYDRCDELQVRQDIFQRIKSGEYPWCVM